MPKLIPPSGLAFIKDVEQMGGRVIRIESSHHLVELNGRRAPVPVHGQKEIPVGTFRSICRLLGIDPNLYRR
jgi:predicted RNA binding protein YcfA (HicA-like mRNA interferase family)